MSRDRASRKERLLDGSFVRVYREDEYEKEYVVYVGTWTENKENEIVKCFNREECDACVDLMMFLSEEECSVDNFRDLCKKVKVKYRREVESGKTIAQSQGEAVIATLSSFRSS